MYISRPYFRINSKIEYFLQGLPVEISTETGGFPKNKLVAEAKNMHDTALDIFARVSIDDID